MSTSTASAALSRRLLHNEPIVDDVRLFTCEREKKADEYEYFIL
mgnify:CR=1 FL=1